MKYFAETLILSYYCIFSLVYGSPFIWKHDHWMFEAFILTLLYSVIKYITSTDDGQEHD